MTQANESHASKPVNAPPILPGELPPPVSRNLDLEAYQNIADTIGMVPSLRMKDNFFQAVFIAVFTLIAVIVGAFQWGFVGGLFSLVGGLFVSLILSGIALMVMGWVRAAKRRRRVPR